MKRKGILLVFLAAIVAVWAASRFLSATSFVRSVETHDNAFFYRVTAHLRLKETGEPILFDIVSSCGYNRIRYKDGDATLNVARDPYLFAKRVGAGGGQHAVMMQVPSFCSARDFKADGSSDLLPGFMPLFVWFDDADSLTHGTAYATADAYRNPNARLVFEGAELHTATQAERDAWEKTAASENLVRREFYDMAYALKIGHFPAGTKAMGNPLSRKQEEQRDAQLRRIYEMAFDRKTNYFNFSVSCTGILKIKLADSGKVIVRQYWPSGHPEFWRAVDREAEATLYRAFDSHSENKFITEPPKNKIFLYSSDTTQRGVADHDGSGTDAPRRTPDEASYAVDTYPMTYDSSTTNRRDKTYSTEPFSLASADLDDRLKGFLDCDSAQLSFSAVPGEPTPEELHKDKPAWRINGIIIPPFPGERVHIGRLFQRDEYLLVPVGLGLWRS